MHSLRWIGTGKEDNYSVKWATRSQKGVIVGTKKEYEIYDVETGELIVKGGSKECVEALGLSSMSNFWWIVKQGVTGRSKKYRVIIKDPDDNRERLDDFADWLVDMRMAYGLTQREVADASGISFVTLNRYERRHRVPSEEFQNKIRDAVIELVGKSISIMPDVG